MLIGLIMAFVVYVVSGYEYIHFAPNFLGGGGCVRFDPPKNTFTAIAGRPEVQTLKGATSLP